VNLDILWTTLWRNRNGSKKVYDRTDYRISNTTKYSLLLIDTTLGTYNVDLGSGSLGSGGQNRVYNGTLFDVLGNLNGTVIQAKNNWWGVVTGLNPAKISLTTGGSITATDFLTSDIGP